jgi:hypothetical protein
MEAEVSLFFRDQLREARAAALRDSEAFDKIIFVLERLGDYLNRNDKSFKYGLGPKKDLIAEHARRSPLAEEISSELRGMHAPFRTLYEMVTMARNTAMHEGASARHLTTHAIELSLILEDALMVECKTVGDYMVRNPVCAFLWQPLSFVRQTMLINSFSFIPVLKNLDSEIVGLVSDLALARYLRIEPQGNLSRDRLKQTLEEAIASKGIECCTPRICTASTSIAEALKEDWNGTPILIRSDSNRLLGILTPFDLI